MSQAGVLLIQLLAVLYSGYTCRCMFEIVIGDKAYFAIRFYEFSDVGNHNFLPQCKVFPGLNAVFAQCVGSFRDTDLLIGGNKIGKIIVNRSTRCDNNFVRRGL